MVDDKPEILHQVMSYSESYRRRELEISNYHMKLADPKADAQAFYEYTKISPQGDYANRI